MLPTYEIDSESPRSRRQVQNSAKGLAFFDEQADNPFEPVEFLQRERIRLQLSDVSQRYLANIQHNDGYIIADVRILQSS